MTWQSGNTTYDYQKTLTAEDVAPDHIFTVHVPDDSAFDKEVCNQRSRKTWSVSPSGKDKTQCSRAAYDALKAGGVPVYGNDSGRIMPGNFGDMLQGMSKMQLPGAGWWITGY